MGYWLKGERMLRAVRTCQDREPHGRYRLVSPQVRRGVPLQNHMSVPPYPHPPTLAALNSGGVPVYMPGNPSGRATGTPTHLTLPLTHEHIPYSSARGGLAPPAHPLLDSRRRRAGGLQLPGLHSHGADHALLLEVLIPPVLPQLYDVVLSLPPGLVEVDACMQGGGIMGRCARAWWVRDWRTPAPCSDPEVPGRADAEVTPPPTLLEVPTRSRFAVCSITHPLRGWGQCKEYRHKGGGCPVIGQSLRLTRGRRSGRAHQEMPCVRYSTAWAVLGV